MITIVTAATATTIAPATTASDRRCRRTIDSPPDARPPPGTRTDVARVSVVAPISASTPLWTSAGGGPACTRPIDAATAAAPGEPNGASAAASSATVSNRRAGSFSRQRLITAANPRGVGTVSAGTGSVASTTASSVIVCAANGRRPHTSS